MGGIAMSDEGRTTDHRTSVRRFLGSAEWLTDDDAPAVAVLEALAAELDVKVTAALAAQFGVTYRALLARKPTTPTTTDPVGALLDEATR